MAKTLTINGTDRTSVMRHFADNNGSPGWVFEETAFRGEIGTGNFLLDDTSTFTVPGMKSVTFDESSASQSRVWTGYVDIRAIQRGNSLRTSTDRQWSVDVEDVNVLLDDQILLGSDDADRPAETDYARVSWLLSTGALSSVSAGVTVPSGSNVDMDAVDYRGQHPRDVLNDCAQKSGKNFFIYRTTALFLFYALASGSTYTSTLQISDLNTDVDNSTTWAAIIEGPSLRRDSSRIYSGVRLRYKGGSVYVRDAAVASSYRTHEASITNMKIKTSTKATQQAQKWLDQANTETDSLPDISVVLPAANVNDIRAGQRAKVKIRHAGITSFTYYRVRSRRITPVDDVTYRVTLTFLDDVRVTKFEGGGTYVDEEQSNATDSDATVIIDENGITVTGGSITVTSDGGSTVTFDGTQETFQVVASGTLSMPRNTKRGDVFNSKVVNTGLNYDPLTIWSMKYGAKGNKGDFCQPLYFANNNIAGQIVEAFMGRAQVTGDNKTRLQGVKTSMSPPLPGVTYRYHILSKRAI